MQHWSQQLRRTKSSEGWFLNDSKITWEQFNKQREENKDNEWWEHILSQLLNHVSRYRVLENQMQQQIHESKGKSWEEIKRDLKEIIKRTKVDDEWLHVAILFSSPLGFEKANGMGGKVFLPVNEIPFTKVVDCFKRAVDEDTVLNV